MLMSYTIIPAYGHDAILRQKTTMDVQKGNDGRRCVAMVRMTAAAVDEAAEEADKENEEGDHGDEGNDYDEGGPGW